MAQTFNYQTFIDAVESTLALNDRFDTADAADKYINQMRKQRWIPGPPFPVILIYPGYKEETQRIQIGYNPYTDFIVQIVIYCSLPSKNSTSAMRTALSLTQIMTGEDSMKELFLITRELEEWLRGEETEDGRNRRKLYLHGDATVSFGVTQIGRVTFEEDKYENFRLNKATINLVIPKVRLITT